MKNETKNSIYGLLLVIGLAIFILQLFIFEAPNGVLGFLLCLFSIYLIVGSTIGLCKINKNFKNQIPSFLDILFFLGNKK